MKDKNENSVSRPIANTFQIVEAYKTLRTNLLFALATTTNKAIVVSSAEPNAGKSTVSSNLAITMAQTGAKVLLVDADMRKPTQHRTFHVKRTNGLSRILSGFVPFDECVIKDVAKHLDLIPSGSLPPNPSELLGSPAMDEFLTEAQKRYDYVFLDTPPIGVVSDSMIVGAKTAGIVLVARQHQTTYTELDEAVKAIRDVQTELLGVVVTDMKGVGSKYGRSERYKYYRAYDYAYVSGMPDKNN